MAKSRKKATPPKLRGGLGDAPAGRGGMADQMFLAREGMGRPVDEDSMLPDPPAVAAPSNRVIEDFRTVKEDLTKQMGKTPQGKTGPGTAGLKNTVKSMMRVIEESGRSLDAQDAADVANTRQVYRESFRTLPTEQQSRLADLAAEIAFNGIEGQPPEAKYQRAAQQRADFLSFFTAAGDPGTQLPLPLSATDLSTRKQQEAMRRAKATAMDFQAGQNDYYTEMRPGGVEAQVGRKVPYGRTYTGEGQRGILNALIDEYGLDPSDVAEANIGDMAMTPFAPQAGVLLDRGSAPVGDRLSDYIGGTTANQFTPREEINPRAVAADEFAQLATLRGKKIENPILGSILDDARDPNTFIAAPMGVSDEVTRRQMMPDAAKIREEIFHRAFGYPTQASSIIASGRSPGGSLLGSLSDSSMLASDFNVDDAMQVEKPMNLDYLAPWHKALIEQAGPDGRVVMAPMNADQITRTMINESMALAEAPELRASAYEKLLPQVEYALQYGSGGGYADKRAKLAINPDGTPRQFNRNPAGRELLQDQGGIYQQPAAAPPPAPRPAPSMPSSEYNERLERALRNRPGNNDTGLLDPVSLPKPMREMSNNRLLAALLG